VTNSPESPLPLVGSERTCARPAAVLGGSRSTSGRPLSMPHPRWLPKSLSSGGRRCSSP